MELQLAHMSCYVSMTPNQEAYLTAHQRVLQEMDCWYKTDAGAVWQKAVMPDWLSSAIGTLNVPWAPSVWQEPPFLPGNLK